MAAVPNKDAAAKPAGSRKTLVIALAALVATGAGAGGYFYSQSKVDGAPAAEAYKPPVFLQLDTFTVNLRDNQSERYLQAGITLEVENEYVSDKIKQNLPIARSRVLLLLSSKQSHDLDKVDDKKRLATEIIAELKSVPALKDTPVRAVHFSAFVIQ